MSSRFEQTIRADFVKMDENDLLDEICKLHHAAHGPTMSIYSLKALAVALDVYAGMTQELVKIREAK